MQTCKHPFIGSKKGAAANFSEQTFQSHMNDIPVRFLEAPQPLLAPLKPALPKANLRPTIAPGIDVCVTVVFGRSKRNGILKCRVPCDTPFANLVAEAQKKFSFQTPEHATVTVKNSTLEQTDLQNTALQDLNFIEDGTYCYCVLDCRPQDEKHNTTLGERLRYASSSSVRYRNGTIPQTVMELYSRMKKERERQWRYIFRARQSVFAVVNNECFMKELSTL